jgi:hypothetical protein
VLVLFRPASLRFGIWGRSRNFQGVAVSGSSPRLCSFFLFLASLSSYDLVLALAGTCIWDGTSHMGDG